MSTLALALLALTPATQVPILPAVDVVAHEPPSAAALTAGGLVWSFHAGNRLPYIALGDRGGQVASINHDNIVRLLSAFDANPPTSVWLSPHATIWADLVAASESDAYLQVQVRADDDDHTAIAALRMFRSRSSVPEWRFEFPADFFPTPKFDLSRDGRTIVSEFSNWNTSSTEIRVHDPSSGQALRTYFHPGYILYSRFDLSPDGAVCAFSDHNALRTTEVFETATGTHLASLPVGIFGNQALSDGGGVLATFVETGSDTFDVRVYARGAGGYVPILDVPMPAGVYACALAVSDDGTTMAAGWWDSRVPRQGIVRAYDLATGTMTMERVDTGATQDIVPRSISISADGSRFVVGMRGNGSGAFPELAVHSPTSSTPLRTHATGGAVYEAELSPDGKRYAVTRTPGNRGYYDAFIEMYEFGDEDFVVRGAPTVGAPITFELHAAAGARAWLLRSFALAPNPIDVPGVGTLHLDPGTLSSSSIGVVPTSGVATHSTIASTVPGMIGRTVWFQGLTTNPRTLSNDFVQLTIVP